MTNVTEHTYLKDVADNLEIGLAGLVDSDGEPTNLRVQKYLLPYPTEPSWVCIHMFGSTMTAEQEGGPRRSNQTWEMPIRVGIGDLGQEWTGIQQEKMFEILPLIVNTILAHPNMTFTGATEKPRYLSPEGASIRPGFQTNIETVETGKILWVEFVITLPFIVDLTVIKHNPDGTEITL